MSLGSQVLHRAVIAHKCNHDDKWLYFGGRGGLFASPWWTADIQHAKRFFVPEWWDGTELEKCLKAARKDRGCVKLLKVTITTVFTETADDE